MCIRDRATPELALAEVAGSREAAGEGFAPREAGPPRPVGRGASAPPAWPGSPPHFAKAKGLAPPAGAGAPSCTWRRINTDARGRASQIPTAGRPLGRGLQR